MAQSEIQVYTAPTMNGWKPLILLEEAEVDYDLVPIDFGRGEQKAEWYLRLNPNGRIPTIVDRGNDGFPVFESGAILWYLAEKYGRFLPHEANARSVVHQWLMFQMGGLGPMMGQAMYFQRIAAPNGYRDGYAIDRFVGETRRLLEIVDERLSDRTFIAGGDFTIADMALYPWARSYFWAGVSVAGLDHLQTWFERIDARPATQRALQLPRPFPEAFGEGDIERAVADNAARFD